MASRSAATSARTARRKLGSRISEAAGRTGGNFLTPEIHTARRAAAYREIGALFDAERLATNLLSSMPLAFNLLDWRETLSVPLIEVVEAELFSGLLRLEPADPRPGDKIEFVMPGSRAEALIAGAGIALPNILVPHCCAPECIRPSRKTSRRWERYLAEWAKESKDAA